MHTANWQSNTIIKYVNTLAGLNCRSTPIIGEVITAYSCGTRLEGNDSSTSGWFYYPGNNCYLSNEFLSTTVPNCGSSGDSSDDGNNTRCGYCETKLDCTGGSGGTCTGTCRDSQGDYPC